jgi:transcriptional regulator with XRE-family HTH domain
MQERANLVKLESLAEYVRRIIYEKKLTIREVARRSDGRITQGYVGGIVQGLHTNLSVEKLKALATGLHVDEAEIFNVARGLSVAEAEGRDPILGALDVVRTIALSPDADEVLEFLQELMTLTASDRSSAISLLRSVLALSGREANSRDQKKTLG